MINKTKHLFLLYTVILILMAISMRATNNMVITTVPLFAKYTLNFSYIFTALATALIYLGTIIATLFINPKLNSVLRRKVFILANIFLVALIFLYYLSNHMSIFLISIFIGLCYGIILPNILTSATLYPDKKGREKLLSIYSVGLSLSLVLGPSLESFLLTFINYRTIFLFFAPIGIIGIVLSFIMQFPEKNESPGKKNSKNRGLWASILTITIYNVPFAALTVFLAIFAKTKFNVSSYLAYIPFVFFFTVSLLVRIYMGIKPLKNIRIGIIIATSITFASLLIFPFLPTYLSFLILMMFLGIPHGIILPISTIEISRGTTIEERNTVNSYFYAYVMSLFMIIPLMFAYIVSYIGFEKTFVVLTIPVAVSLLLLISKYWKCDTIFGNVMKTVDA